VIVGNVVNTDEFSWAESYLLVNVNGTLTPNTAQNFTIGTFTMPFAGDLIADLLVKFMITDNQLFRAGLQNATPAPTSMSQFAWWNGLSGGYTYAHDMPVVGRWASLAKGAVVTVVTTVTNGGNPVNLSVPYIGGRLRASAT
jgi:hypothetical protein